MQKKSKILVVSLIIATILALGSVCFARWSYLIDCANTLREVRIGLFSKGVLCGGATSVDYPDEVDAGVTVLLKQLDDDGDWVTYTGWSDRDDDIAVVSEEIQVPDGTYKLEVYHKAYEEGTNNVLEFHTSYSVTCVVD